MEDVQRSIICIPAGEAFIWCPPDGMSGSDMPSEFAGVLDHVDDNGDLWVVQAGYVANDFTQSVFHKRKSL